VRGRVGTCGTLMCNWHYNGIEWNGMVYSFSLFRTFITSIKTKKTNPFFYLSVTIVFNTI